MAATIPKPFNFISTESSRRTHSKLLFSFSPNPQKPISHRRHLHISNSISNANPSPAIISTTTNTPETTIAPRFDPDVFRKESDVLVESLEREGVKNVFAYPGGASLEIHQALTRSNIIRNILPRLGIFAAEGYARSSGLVGVCIATSGPGATNLVSGLADAMLDSIPIISITGQLPRRMIGTDAFQEIPIVELTRSITKHNYLVLDVGDIPKIVCEAFFLAVSGQPGPVLIDIPKDIQQLLDLRFSL